MNSTKTADFFVFCKICSCCIGIRELRRTRLFGCILKLLNFRFTANSRCFLNILTKANKMEKNIYMTYNYSDTAWEEWVIENAVHGEIDYR